jgi:hypothetical protein
MNLHAIARRAVSSVNAEETVTLYRNIGHTSEDGVLTPEWAPPETVSAQVQTEKEDALQWANETGSVVVTRKFYLFGTPLDRAEGIDRPRGKGGDVLKRTDGTWWLITAVLEDFSGSGWTSVRGTLQTGAPLGLEVQGG